jgi:hypothetical protein
VLSPVFMVLPDPGEYPDYYELIRRPISFAEVKAKLDKREYDNVEAVKDDFNLMFTNAKRYNAQGSFVYEDARRLHVRSASAPSMLKDWPTPRTARAQDAARQHHCAHGRGRCRREQRPVARQGQGGPDAAGLARAEVRGHHVPSGRQVRAYRG